MPSNIHSMIVVVYLMLLVKGHRTWTQNRSDQCKISQRMDYKIIPFSFDTERIVLYYTVRSFSEISLTHYFYKIHNTCSLTFSLAKVYLSTFWYSAKIHRGYNVAGDTFGKLHRQQPMGIIRKTHVKNVLKLHFICTPTSESVYL